MTALRICLITLFLSSTALHSQLASRFDRLGEKYEEDRTKGLIALNQRFIERFEEELKSVVQANQLEEAIKIKDIIKGLKEEIAELEKIQKGGPMDAESAKDLLVGKQIEFPAWPETPDKMAYFRFGEDGQAAWLGTGNQEVERAYKPTDKPGSFELWWPGRSPQGNYDITVSEDGKTATLFSHDHNVTMPGKIIRDR